MQSLVTFAHMMSSDPSAHEGSVFDFTGHELILCARHIIKKKEIFNSFSKFLKVFPILC